MKSILKIALVIAVLAYSTSKLIKVDLRNAPVYQRIYVTPENTVLIIANGVAYYNIGSEIWWYAGYTGCKVQDINDSEIIASKKIQTPRGGEGYSPTQVKINHPEKEEIISCTFVSERNDQPLQETTYRVKITVVEVDPDEPTSFLS